MFILIFRFYTRMKIRLRYMNLAKAMNNARTKNLRQIVSQRDVQ